MNKYLPPGLLLGLLLAFVTTASAEEGVSAEETGAWDHLLLDRDASAVNGPVSPAECVSLDTNPPSAGDGSAARVTIDSSTDHQRIEGFGATTLTSVIFTPQGMRDQLNREIRQRALRAVYDQVGLTMGNLEVSIESRNDDADPFHYNWNGFRWTSMNAVHDLVLRPAEQYGFDNYSLGLKIELRWEHQWMVPLRKTDYTRYLDEIAEYVTAGTLYWRNTFNRTPRYIMLFNEPTSGGVELNGGGIQQVVDIIKRAGERLRAEGFDDVLFVVPGEASLEQSIKVTRTILGDEEARGYVGAIAYHAYPYSSTYARTRNILETSGSGRPSEREIKLRTELKNLARKYDIPLWMTEISEGPGRRSYDFGSPENLRARAIHIHDEFKYAGASAYYGMNNMWDRKSHEAHFQGRNVGFRTEVSSIALIDQYTDGVYITGMGYAIGHYARWIDRGAVRIGARSDDPLVQVTAFRDDKGAQLTTVIVNNHGTKKSINVRLQGTGIAGSVKGEQSYGTVRWQSLCEFTPDEAMLRLEVEPRSVTTLSAVFSR